MSEKKKLSNYRENKMKKNLKKLCIVRIEERFGTLNESTNENHILFGIFLVENYIRFLGLY